MVETKFRVGVVQAEPEYLDLQNTVNKTCAIIKDAAKNGARLIAFPEVWIPGYPGWIWSRSVDFELNQIYIKNSLKIDSVEMRTIQETAASSKIAVALGFSENDNNSLYMAQALIDPSGKLLVARRKIMPTHIERTVYGNGTGNSLHNVGEVFGVRVGMLNCWEHFQPLLKYHSALEKEAIHVASWPPGLPYQGLPGLYTASGEGFRSASRSHAIETQSFVLHATSIIGERGIKLMGTQNGLMLATPGGGSSVIYGPDGRQISEDLGQTEEGIIYADLNLDEILRTKTHIDVTGQYSRPDLLWLGVDDREKKHVRYEQKPEQDDIASEE